MSVYKKLETLGITLPQMSPPLAAFVPFVRSGHLLFLSGHIAIKEGKPWVGQFGPNLSGGTRQIGGPFRGHRPHGNAACRRGRPQYH